jgi:hypothetical protein
MDALTIIAIFMILWGLATLLIMDLMTFSAVQMRLVAVVAGLFAPAIMFLGTIASNAVAYL